MENSSMKIVAFRLQPGADLRLGLLAYCAEHRIDAACMVGCVGSLRSAVLRFADQSQGTSLSGKQEILSLSGTLSRHGCHLHIALADSAGAVTGGHLMAGSLIHTTAEIVLALMPGIEFKRVLDARTGYQELQVSDLKDSD
jgi:predicted DNA-binding protein with PD1-like motif